MEASSSASIPVEASFSNEPGKAGAASGGATQMLDKKDFQVIYPQYLDAAITPKQGRRLTKTQAVATPTMEEIIEALRHLGYKRFVRDSSRSYSRSQADPYFPLVPRECIRVAVKHPRSVHYIKKSEFDTEEREPVVLDIPSKMELLRRVAAYIKETHPTRPSQPSVESVVEQFPKAMMPSMKTKQQKIKCYQ